MTEEIDDFSEGFGVWRTLTELAELKGIGKAALSERVSRLESQGLITTRAGKGRTKLINVAEYDRVVGQVADLAREQGQATRRGGEDDGDGGEGGEGASASGTYTREQAKRQGYLAEIARLDLEERLGRLVKVDELRPAIEAAIAATVAAIDSLTHEADGLRELAQAEDATAFDRALRDTAHRIRREAARALREALKGREAA